MLLSPEAGAKRSPCETARGEATLEGKEGSALSWRVVLEATDGGHVAEDSEDE